VSRYARRQDASQGEVLQALAVAGLSVRDLSHAGQGCPDAVVSFDGRTALVEVKTSGTAYGKRLNGQQRAWRDGDDTRRPWAGEYAVLRTGKEALDWAVAWKACTR
jgi:hypothetical protein